MLVSRALFRRQARLVSSLGYSRPVQARMATADSTDNRFTIAVCQMNSTADKVANFASAKSLVTDAAARGARIVFLPECFDFVGEHRSHVSELAEPLSGDLVGSYRELARKSNVWLSLGGFHQKVDDDKRILNTHIMVNNDGKLVATYEKIHVFDFEMGDVRLFESDFTTPGSLIRPPVSTGFCNIGLGICYDVRFGEMATALRRMGADILTYPSAFTQPTGRAHWEVLMRARAIESQCYVVSAAQVGAHNPKRASYGHAIVCDPWGRVLADCGDEGVQYALAEIDMSELCDVRERMPVMKHRRHDCYSPLIRVPIDSNDTYQFGEHQISKDHTFFLTEHSFAFVNRKPVIPGHVLVSPRTCFPRLADVPSHVLAELFSTVQSVGKLLQRKHGVTSLTVSVQDGPDSGQTVPHVHVHILPRRPGDFQQNDQVYSLLENSSDCQFRNFESMAHEAFELRTMLKNMNA